MLKSIGILTFGLWFLASAILEFSEEPTYSIKWTTNHFLEVFPEAIRVFPALLNSTSSLVSFLLIPCGWIIFQILVTLRIAYLSEQEFLKDCNQQNIFSHQPHRQILHSTQEKPRSLTKTVTDFFTSRSFTLQKKSGFVRIEFYIVSSQDIQAILESKDPQANISTIISFWVIFLFSVVLKM
jgi:hypothetical protein